MLWVSRIRLEEGHRVECQGRFPEKWVFKLSHNHALPLLSPPPPTSACFWLQWAQLCPAQDQHHTEFWSLCENPSHEGRLTYNVRAPGSPQSDPRLGPRTTALFFEFWIIYKTLSWLVLAICCFVSAVYFLATCMLFLYHLHADIRRPRAEWTSHLLLCVEPQLIHSQNSQVGCPSSFHQQEPCLVHLFIPNTASHCSRVWELEQRIKETMLLTSQSLQSASL